MEIGARPRVWSFFNAFHVCLNLLMVYVVVGSYSLSCVGAVSRDRHYSID
jgi:hypothetical protein